MVLFDYRENRSSIPKLLKQFNITAKMANLTVDYIVAKDYFVERKTVNDFAASVADSRIFKQVHSLTKICPNPLIILEGDMAQLHSRINTDVIRGVVLWIILQKKVPVLQTRNEYITACILRLLTKKYGKALHVNRESLPRKQKFKSFWQQQMDLLTQIPGIGRQTAKDLLTSFGSVTNLTKAADSDLINLPHIGKERLEAVRRIFPYIEQDKP